MKMIAINSCDTAMAVAHVFAEENVSDRDQVRAFRFDRSQRSLNYAIFSISAACLFILVRWNPKKQDRLQADVLSLARFIDNLFHRQLKNSRHTGDRLASLPFFAHKQRQNKIVNVQVRLTNEVPQRRGTPQTTRPMD